MPKKNLPTTIEGFNDELERKKKPGNGAAYDTNEDENDERGTRVSD